MNDQVKFYTDKLAYEIDPTDLYFEFEKSEDLLAVDTRKAHDYEKEHIPSAINLPHGEINLETTKHLDKSKIYICYGNGIGCNASIKGALKLTKLDFKVKELVGGLKWWKFDGFATEGANASTGLKSHTSVKR